MQALNRRTSRRPPSADSADAGHGPAHPGRPGAGRYGRCRRRAGAPARGVRVGVLTLLALAFSPAPAAQPWLLVDTRAETIIVMDETGPRQVFENIAVGTRGVGLKQRRGDEITPRGSFRIGWINPQSRFKLFFGLDYPNREHALLAWRDGRIDEKTYRRIVEALDAGRRPPQNTPLGGQIGFHGLGGRDEFYHANTDWTQGCIALTNRQIVELARWIGVGTEVEIR